MRLFPDAPGAAAPSAERRGARGLRLAPLALALAGLAGCSSIGNLFGDDKVDYRSAAAKTQPLEVPPDLTQLARETRYQPQAGVVSASAVAANAATAASPAPAASAAVAVAAAQLDGMRIERDGQQRWLVVPRSPEQLWPLLRMFWERNGFTLAVDNPQTGILETNWAENRAKLPNDVIRNTIGRLLGNLYDTGERDLYRTRIERTAGGSEIYISHRGVVEAYTDERHESTAWRAAPPAPGLEAEMLSRLMLALAGHDEAAKAEPTAAATPGATPGATPTAVPAAVQLPARARAIAGANTATMEVDEPFERAWRRVGLALDRGGFTVEDRDRAQGIYYVRYVDPTTAGTEEPGFFAKLFGSAKAQSGPVRYRIALEGRGDKTTIRVLTSAGAPEPGSNGQRIVAQLVGELR